MYRSCKHDSLAKESITAFSASSVNSEDVLDLKFASLGFHCSYKSNVANK